MRREEPTKQVWRPRAADAWMRTLTVILLAHLPVPIIAIHLNLTASTDLHQGVIWLISGMMALVVAAQLVWITRRRRSIVGRVLAMWLDDYRTSRIRRRDQAPGAA